MSLFELHYVNKEAEQKRLEKQQKSIQNAFKELLVSSRKQQIQEQQLLSNYGLHAGTRVESSNSLYADDTSSIHSVSSIFSSLHSSASSITTIDSDTNDRDDYGFKKPFEWIKPEKIYEFESRYKTIQQKQSKRWYTLLQNNHHQWPELCPELIHYVRKGLPPQVRAKAWMHYSGAGTHMEANPGLYQSLLLQIEQEPTLIDESIQKDLFRTFPDNTHFTKDTKITMLQHVLSAFSLYLPDIGYCQSLNFLAGFLLLFYDTEEQVFWMLVTIVQDYFPKEMFDTTMQGTQLEQTVLMNLIYEHMPAIWSKISDKKCFWEYEQVQGEFPSITFITTHWFLTMYIHILPVETVLRVWDCFFIEGFKVLYQVALTILKLNEQRIYEAEDAIEAFQILQSMPKRMIDCDQFIKCIFSSKNDIVLDLTLQDIDHKRILFRTRKQQRLS
ncbi:rab-GTPase-TBC domain-containing protein [Gilbertella persicaria]|uniref:rab-GTPase-TBC domain-containing protein n=1 Tax=Gilbertella persicaria TaxID=101096 RepID=UPI00222079CB|nr:rab-GTPase-TBC domain-containing protein [Gilbertella persicaria]KAI8050662.1 rab-GTPase-TBC domain-containing protein [Gilbertella persicaria]